MPGALRDPLYILHGHDRAREAEPRGLGEPLLAQRDRADLAGEAELAEHHGARVDRAAARRRGDRARDAEIDRRLGEPQPTGDVDEHVAIEHVARGALREHREQERRRDCRRRRRRCAGRCPAVAGATSAWISTSSGRVPSAEATTTEPGAPIGRSASRCADGFATSAMPAPAISNTPISWVEPKRFLCARRIRYGPAIALELEHDIDEVLERLRAGEPAVLRDVADDHDRRAGGLRVLDQPARALADLRERARDRIERGRVHGLDRIDREHRGPRRVRVRDDLLDIGLGDDRDRARPRHRLDARASRFARPILRPSRTARGPCRDSPASAWISSVDLPTPGSPPSNTAEPATKPPPSTRSSSPMPTTSRVPLISTTFGDRLRPLADRDAVELAPWSHCRANSSTSEFHSWHAGQRPHHLVSLWPQRRQT